MSNFTYYFNPASSAAPYAFRDPELKKWIYYDDRAKFIWGEQGKEFVKLNYNLMKSPVPELDDYEYTGYYYYKTFAKGSYNLAAFSTMGSG